MQGSYDAVLVLLSVLTAVIASFVALDMASRVASAVGRARRANFWLACGALAMGSGIWGMHFVGMLAFSLPVPLAYEIFVTVASWLVAVLSSALALHTVSRPSMGWRRLIGAGVLMGLGIAAMHYLGMEAMRMYPRIAYDPWLFALSVVIAIAASTVALLISFRLRHEGVVTGLRKRLLAALVMGLAIVGMHYTGMAAAGFAADSICRADLPDAFSVGGAWLGIIIAGMAVVVLAAILLTSVYGAIPPTVRSRLVFLVVAAVLPVSVMAIVAMLYGYQREHGQQGESLVVTARTLVTSIDKELGGIESGLRVLATSRPLASGDLAAFRVQAREVSRHLRVDAITLENAHGDVLASTYALPEDSLPPDRVTRHRRSVAVPVKLPAALAATMGSQGLLRAELRAGGMLDLLGRQQLSSDWIVAVYDRQDAIVARSRDNARFVGLKGPLLLQQRAQEVREDVLDAVSLEGIPVLSAFSRSPETGWSVSISIPRKSISAPLTRSLSWLLAGLLLTLVISTLLAWRIGGGIAKAVEALTVPALALGSGTPVSVRALGLTEADKVGAALTRASQLLDTAQHEANHDGLTGLANRSLFRQMVQQQLALAQRSGTALSVLYIDLDGFKPINDLYGHAMGDALLQQVAQRLLQGVRAGDLVARLGGDEFAVALVNSGPQGLAKVAGKLVDSLSQPFVIAEVKLDISASIGAASYGPDSATVASTCEALLEQADAAMYQAKQAGKRRFVLATPQTDF
ncbi:sensor domain-containing diguanylate cyclase [Uliginosibacterium sp. H1]|uniref:sensor domain-containing diguanylate cyclase n=1 Tax=Uliginosibacterium sp. H1 TaxID=3114757 RepID=UPI002E1875F9|nr:diguanylate cyclase [Uliginosibacterium sp. H1]